MHIIIARAAALAALTLAAAGCGVSPSLQPADPRLEATCTPEPNAPPRCVQGTSVPVAPIAEGEGCGGARRWVNTSGGSYVCVAPPPPPPREKALPPAPPPQPDPERGTVICSAAECRQAGRLVSSPGELLDNICGPTLMESWHPSQGGSDVVWTCRPPGPRP